MEHNEFERAVKGLDARDFYGFARRVERRSKIAAEAIKMHAEAADGNSPDVSEWAFLAWDDADRMASAGVRTVRAARTWWLERYT